MTQPAIRDATPDDAEAMCEIAVAAWAPIFASFRQILGKEVFEAAFPRALEEKAREARAAYQPDHPGRTCVAELEGRVVGFITFYVNRESGMGEIGNNAVHPDSQGRGIGPRMYEHVFARLREMGAGFVRVSTGGDPSHAPARRAYEKAGFSLRIPGVEYFRKL